MLLRAVEVIGKETVVKVKTNYIERNRISLTRLIGFKIILLKSYRRLLPRYPIGYNYRSKKNPFICFVKCCLQKLWSVIRAACGTRHATCGMRLKARGAAVMNSTRNLNTGFDLGIHVMLNIYRANIPSGPFRSV